MNYTITGTTSKCIKKSNLENITLDAGNNIEVTCSVELPNIDRENIGRNLLWEKIL